MKTIDARATVAQKSKTTSMKIALLSDIHDHEGALAWALAEILTHGAAQIFALGDYCSPTTIAQLAAAKLPTFAVWGNNDADKQAMLAVAREHNPHMTFAPQEFGEITLDNKKFFLTHYPTLAENAATVGDYAAVFHGHTHYARNEKIGTVPIVNPGAIMPHTDTPSTFAIFDTDTTTVQHITRHEE